MPASLLIITPVYDGKLPLPYLGSLFGTFEEMQRHGGLCRWTAKAGGSLLPMARNQLAAEALADPAWTHLLMIDADMEWRPQDITRLIAHNLPFVAGVYACKTEPAAAVKLECVRLPGKRTDPAHRPARGRLRRRRVHAA